MGFRTLEVSNAAEIHIKNGQMVIQNETGTVAIPIEDLSLIMVHGANIRMSTMDFSILTQNKVGIITLDVKYLPTAIVLPFEGHTRQSMLMHAQVHTSDETYLNIWLQLIRRKISNQARTLSILGLEGAENIMGYLQSIDENNVDRWEAQAAREYFPRYHAGLNRRNDNPVNSRLNYGYAIVRSAIARSLVVAGFHPTFGIHHNNQLNAFNLADDVIDPYRPMVDMVVHGISGTNEILNKTQRKEIIQVLHNACMIEGKKMSILCAIDLTCESLKRIILHQSDEELSLPVVLPAEKMEVITE